MDLYLTSSEPGLTLQEMIDCDIKCGIEFEDGLDHFMHPHDLDSLSHLGSDLDFKSLEGPLFDPLEKFEEDDTIEVVDDSTVGSWMNYCSNLNVDLEHGIMVNPSVVLPSTIHGSVNSRPASQLLSVSSPASKKSSEVPQGSTSTLTNGNHSDLFIKKEETGSSQQLIKTEQGSNTDTRVILHPVNTTNVTTQTNTSLCLKNGIHNPTTFVTPLNRGSSTTPIITIPSTQTNHSSNSITTIQPAGHLANGASLGALGNGTSIVSAITTPMYHQNRINVNGAQLTHRVKPLPKYKRERTPDERVFPKPAYSYSCLIALALKNSITGSLPVSEIYSFMCEHFPYFRTAPNGWKNSVRHNLSLNKCFEKIEKPVVSGSNQRKGCLWALNPAKAHKMDEEVQKWSKKDLQGIKDAMTNPEILGNLERGEVKFEATSSGASSCSEDEEEEEMETVVKTEATDIQSIKILNPLSTVVLPQNGHQKSVTGARVVENVKTINTLATKSVNTVQGPKQIASSTTNNNQTQRRRPSQSGTIITSSQESEYILPDSTMPEINIQSNGAIIDDYGNEIAIEGEVGVLNPSGGTTSSLILRKVNSPLKRSSIKSNFVYTASPHQNGLNRLVISNTKMSS